MKRPGRTYKHNILLSGKLVLANKRILKEKFYLEMLSHKAINDIMQTPKKEVCFSSFEFIVLFLIAFDN